MDVAVTGLLVPILLFGPGYGLLPQNYPKRLRLPFVLCVSFLISSSVGLILALFNSFDVRWLVVSAVAFLAFRWRSKVWPRVPLRGHRMALGLTALLAVFAVCTAGEPFDANGDSGVYTIAALHLAQTGEWTWSLADLVPDDVPRSLAISTPKLVRPWQEIAPGFIVDGEKVSNQFFPLYSVWGAAFADWFGIHCLLVVNLIGALMLLVTANGMSRFFLRGPFRRLVLIAIVLNPAFLVFLKYPTAEVFLAGILAGWLYWMVLFLRSPTVKTAVIPSALIAAAILTKFFAWAVAGIVMVALLWLGWRRRAALMVFVGFITAAVLVGLWTSAHHVENHLGQLTLLAGAKVAVVACLLLLIARVVWSARLTSWAVYGAALSYGAVNLWLWFSGEAEFLRDLSALSGQLVVWGSTLGLIWFVWKQKNPAALFPAVVCGCINIYLFLGSGDTPFYPFAGRRFVPLTIPLGALFLAYLIQALIRLTRERIRAVNGVLSDSTATTVVALCCLLGVLLPPLWTQYQAVVVAHGSGFSRTLAELRNAVPEGSPVLSTGRAWRYAPFLLLVDQRPVFCVDVEHPAKMAEVARFIDTDPEALVLATGWRGGEVLAEVNEKRPRIESTIRPPLRQGRSGGADFVLVAPSRLNEGAPFKDLDIGGEDSLLVKGCYAAETVGERTFRWTGRTAWLVVAPGSKMQFVWSKGAHPEESLPVRIRCQGKILGTDRIIERGWLESRWFDIPASDGRVLVELHTHTFRPGGREGKRDSRVLGFKLDRVIVR